MGGETLPTLCLAKDTMHQFSALVSASAAFSRGMAGSSGSSHTRPMNKVPLHSQDIPQCAARRTGLKLSRISLILSWELSHDRALCHAACCKLSDIRCIAEGEMQSMALVLGANTSSLSSFSPVGGVDHSIVRTSISVYENIYRIYKSPEVQKCLQVRHILAIVMVIRAQYGRVLQAGKHKYRCLRDFLCNACAALIAIMSCSSFFVLCLSHVHKLLETTGMEITTSM